MNKLYAIVGMCGSGKSIASDYLVSKGFNKVYFGGVTMDKLKEANLEVNPENEKMMREKLRSELGMGAFAIVLLPKIKECFNNGNTVLDGVYSYDEVKILKENFSELKIIASLSDNNLLIREYFFSKNFKIKVISVTRNTNNNDSNIERVQTNERMINTMIAYISKII